MAAMAIDQVHLVLRDSFILDSGATNHMCNDRRRFVDFKPAGREDFLIAGNSTVVVQGYGTVEVTLDCKVTKSTPTGKRKFLLKNTLYIPTFTTNIVSYNKLFDVEIVWDSRAGLLKWKDVVIGKTRRLHNQWVLEYKKVEMAYPAVSTYTEKPKAKWTIQEAHEKTGHTFPEALRHLPEACQDIASVTGEHDPACETCRKFDAHRQISRRQPNRAH
jgi:hypothetical protein